MLSYHSQIQLIEIGIFHCSVWHKNQSFLYAATLTGFPGNNKQTVLTNFKQLTFEASGDVDTVAVSLSQSRRIHSM